MRAWRIVERNAFVYRRVWRGSLFLNFLQPLLFLVSMGLGVGGMLGGGAAFPGGASFVVFLAPGLLASTCMQTASFESSFPIMGKMTWRRNYEAIGATPMRVIDIVVGELAWIGLRLLTVAAAFGIVLAVFGIAHGTVLVGAVLSAVLTGLVFSASIMAYAATLKNGANFNAVFRFGITPLFLFSGVFFPVSRLPPGLRHVAEWTPLYHGVELARGLVLHTMTVAEATVHIAYLMVLLAAGTVAAWWTFTRKLRA